MLTGSLGFEYQQREAAAAQTSPSWSRGHLFRPHCPPASQ